MIPELIKMYVIHLSECIMHNITINMYIENVHIILAWR